MAHIFSVQFLYNDREYTAVISELQDSIGVYIPDDNLHHILPLGRFYFKPGQHLETDPLKKSSLEHLMILVQSAIESSNKLRVFSKQ